MIHTIADAKVAFKTLFHTIAQDKKQHCYKYNELKVCIYISHYMILYILYFLITKITAVSGNISKSKSTVRRKQETGRRE